MTTPKDTPSLDLHLLNEFVNEHIQSFHVRRLERLSQLTLKDLIQKNPYLFRAKNVNRASELIEQTMAAFLSSSEEKIFGDFLESLALFVAQQSSIDAHKSATSGLDLEFSKNGVYYVVSIKSGPNWGNSSQHSKLEDDFRKAQIRLRQASVKLNVVPVLGICYGKSRSVWTKGGYLKLVGQNFWALISGEKDFYIQIVEPVGYRAKEHNERYLLEKDRIANKLTKDFIEHFCDERGQIDWVKLVQANSGGYDLEQILSG
ncbi:MAG TPA: cytosolic protein [Anaerolinea thermolimosa]|uniref:Cytosolic protein n=1 Tax=Anaerolinea thermolimosa TaxID=229919 RepID=A0A3D1JIH5_9CHLR|nr:PmeII family type II restriction endonuclease [Anaerolinea thermolimosa]GAP05328.1 type II restriction endonuclease EcoO109I [Anaerolinea thermolimosa]HCE18312.1 cytosolic protein [Anaerolinea thermolimosa]